MFTDGLIERRGMQLDDRLAPGVLIARRSPATEPDQVADFVIDAMMTDGRSSDDIVVLTARRRRLASEPSPFGPTPVPPGRPVALRSVSA